MIYMTEDMLHGSLIDQLLDREVVVLVAANADVLGLLGPARQQDGPVSADSLIRFHDLEINLEKRHVCSGGRSLSVTEQELSLLALLANRAGRAFSFRELFSQVWMWEHGVDPPVAHSAVRRLRRKLCSAGAGVTIESVRGYGFRLVHLDNGAGHRHAG